LSHVDQNYGRGGSKRWHNWFNQMAVITVKMNLICLAYIDKRDDKII